MLAAAAEIQNVARLRREAPAHSALAAAHLVLGQADEAVRILEPLTRQEEPNAQHLNDLAAAYLTRAIDADRSEDLLRALEHATRAADLEPSLTEALYNRALALEELRLDGEANKAWQLLLASDDDEGWREDAGRRLETLKARPTPDFVGMERRLKTALEQGSEQEIDAAVRAQVGIARDIFELDLLPEVSSQETASRRLAASYRRVTGDSYQEVVLDLAPPSALEARAQLFAKARREHDAGRRGVARPLFEQVVAAGQANDPLSLWSRLHIAGALHDTRVAYAGAALDSVIGLSGKRSFRTLLARALWFRGIISIGEARYDEALRSLSKAKVVLESTGDAEYGPYVELMRAEAFDAIGNESRAMRSLVEALRGRGRLRQTSRQLGVLLSADQETAASGLPRASRSLLAEARPLVEASGVEIAPLEWLLDSSRISEIERPGEGLAELHQGRALLSRIKDPALRARLDTELAITIGELSVPESPLASVPAIRGAIRAATVRQAFFRLPTLHLNAARLLAREGRGAEAMLDLENGLRFFERTQSLEDDLLLSSAYRALGLYGALIDELVDGGAPAAASLSVADRAYELTFAGVGALKDSREAAFGNIPQDAGVVAYYVAPRGVVAWVVRQRGVTVQRLALGREVFSELDDAETWLAQTGSNYTARLERLGDALVAPLSNRLAGLSRIVVVPHGRLNNVPFAGLRVKADPDPWGAQVALSVAPSVRYAVQQRPFKIPRTALVIGDPDTQGRLPRLPGALREAELLGRLYPVSDVLLGPDSTLERWLRMAPAADALHLGAHAEVDRRFPSRSHLLLAGDGTADLRADQIARLELSRVSLVTLAACESGWTTDGTVGTFSLARPFLRAGAGSVVGSLIHISDAESAAALGPFVQGVLRGTSPSRALQALYKSRTWPARLGWLTLYGSLAS